MSVHAMIAAAYVEDLPPADKLVLMAMCDSSDEHTKETAPGLPKLRAWSGRSKSQTLRIVKGLEDSRRIARVSAGRLGRRAVWTVFPDGIPAIPHPNEVAARYETAGSQPCDPTELPTMQDAPVENEGDRVAPTHPIGSHSGPSRVAPARPLQSYPSVSNAPSAPEVVETRRPAPPASGFPGSRATVEEDRAVARRAHGANNVECPIHAGMVVPCGRCANAAADERARKSAADLARQLIREATAPVAPPTDTDTEEQSA